ncbi:MAG: hypothetical protein ABIP33_06480 [Pseudolysinimonas sp.]
MSYSFIWRKNSAIDTAGALVGSGADVPFEGRTIGVGGSFFTPAHAPT